MPVTNNAYWVNKIRQNVARDQKNRRLLVELGWSVIDIWECETKDSEIPRIMCNLSSVITSNGDVLPKPFQNYSNQNN